MSLTRSNIGKPSSAKYCFSKKDAKMCIGNVGNMRAAGVIDFLNACKKVNISDP